MKTNWIKPVSPETLPPGAERHWLSPDVWLALSDGQVVRGHCLHRQASATHPELVHTWFAIHPEHGSSSLGCDFWNGATVVAWALFDAPAHPDSQFPTSAQASSPLAAINTAIHYAEHRVHLARTLDAVTAAQHEVLNLHAARAAVAELIDADLEWDRVCHAWSVSAISRERFETVRARRQAALERAGGMA